MAALTISENDGLAIYTIGGTPSTGPFNVDFPYFSASEVVVTKVVAGVETTLTNGTHYTLTGTAADDGYSSGSVSLLSSLSNCTIVIERSLSTVKATNFARSGPLQIKTLNTYFSRLFSWQQDLDRRLDLAISIPATDKSLGLTLEPAARSSRSGKLLAWGADGSLSQSNVSLSDMESVVRTGIPVPGTLTPDHVAINGALAGNARLSINGYAYIGSPDAQDPTYGGFPPYYSIQIASISRSNPCVVTMDGAHGYTDGTRVTFTIPSGMTELDGVTKPVTVLSSTSFSIPVDSSAYTPYTAYSLSTNVTGAANNGSGLIRLAVASTAGMTSGRPLIVSGVTGTTEANGTWTMTVIDGTHVDLVGSTFTNAYVSGGTAEAGNGGRAAPAGTELAEVNGLTLRYDIAGGGGGIVMRNRHRTGVTFFNTANDVGDIEGGFQQNGSRTTSLSGYRSFNHYVNFGDYGLWAQIQGTPVNMMTVRGQQWYDAVAANDKRGFVGLGGVTSPLYRLVVGAPDDSRVTDLVVTRHDQTYGVKVSLDGSSGNGTITTFGGSSNLSLSAAGTLALASPQVSGLLYMGGKTASFPALRRSSAVLEAVLGDETAYASMRAISYYVDANKVIGARDTGWAAMTGTSNKNTVYDTATVTLAQLAGRVMAIQAALNTHGLIGT